MNDSYALTEEKRVSGPHVGKVVSLHVVGKKYPYGFLQSDQSMHDIYFAFCDIESGTASRIRRGQSVEFILYRVSDDTRRGLRAKVKHVTKHGNSNKCTDLQWKRGLQTRRKRSLGKHSAPAARIARGPSESGCGFQYVRTVKQTGRKPEPV